MKEDEKFMKNYVYTFVNLFTCFILILHCAYAFYFHDVFKTILLLKDYNFIKCYFLSLACDRALIIKFISSLCLPYLSFT